MPIPPQRLELQVVLDDRNQPYCKFNVEPAFYPPKSGMCEVVIAAAFNYRQDFNPDACIAREPMGMLNGRPC
jgi:hypothetical protein